MITTTATAGPADFAGVRTANLSIVLRHVRANSPCSRADIAASTGLNKATVSSLVAELIDRRLVRETGLAEQRIGRPATLLVLDGAPYAAIGLSIDVDALTLVATDLSGERLVSWRRAFAGADVPPNRAVTAVAALARRAITRLAAEGRQVLGLTITVPGLVDGVGEVRYSANLGWHDIDLTSRLERALGGPGFPVVVDNDANLAASAEHRYGGHRFGGNRAANLVYLCGGTGVGAGIIADGRLLRGNLGYAGEIGHVAVKPDGLPCSCGRRGCLEAYAGLGPLLRRLSPDGTEGADLQPEVEDLARRARSGEPAVLEALTELGWALGYGASVLANVVNPEVVVLGGAFAALAEWVVPPAQAELAARTVAPHAGGCRVVPSTLGHSAAALGAAARVLDSVDAGQVQALRAG